MTRNFINIEPMFFDVDGDHLKIQSFRLGEYLLSSTELTHTSEHKYAISIVAALKDSNFEIISSSIEKRGDINHEISQSIRDEITEKALDIFYLVEAQHPGTYKNWDKSYINNSIVDENNSISSALALLKTHEKNKSMLEELEKSLNQQQYPSEKPTDTVLKI